MAKRSQRFQHPPEDPRKARDSSLVFRLNLDFFFRQLFSFAFIDLLILLLVLFGKAIAERLSAPIYMLGVIVLAVQVLILMATLFAGDRTVRKLLRPIQDLSAAASRLSARSHASRQELRDLASKLDQIGINKLDSRVDVSATQKELQMLAQAINDLLDRVDRAYSAQMRFVSDASHELRTPIAVIQGYAALLDRWGKTNPDALQESIDAIRSESQAMEQLVEQLLFLARGDNDSQPWHPQHFNISALAGAVLREEELIHPERTFVPGWGEEPVIIVADPGLVKQLMRILLDNAIKYSPPEGRIYLRIACGETYARVTVQDEGIGIPPESLPHIFERFYRSDSSRDRKTGGTGLGLAIAKWIVDRHAGWFEIISRQGAGSRFTFVLPVNGPPGTVPEDEDEEETEESPVPEREDAEEQPVQKEAV